MEYVFDRASLVMVRLLSKCASTHMLENLCRTQDDQAREIFSKSRTMLAFIRDPVDRLVSGFRFWFTSPDDWRYSPCYERYVDRALVVDEEHWTPQAKVLEDGIWPTHIYRFEEIMQRWAQWKLPYMSPAYSEPQPLVNRAYRFNEVKARYRTDYALRGE